MKDKKYDLQLGSWGPYNKEYLGICHIADPETGATFNVELFPGFFRRRVLVSHSSSDEGLKMWGANASLTRFTYRYELEWRDAVYCDAEFTVKDDSVCLIECTFVNNTERMQSVNMNLCASLQYPTSRVGRAVVGYRIPWEAVLPSNCCYIDAVDYDCVKCQEMLASDGRFLGEQTVEDATGKGTAIGGKYFFSKSHKLSYTLPRVAKKLVLRYAAKKETSAVIAVGGTKTVVALPASSSLSTVAAELPEYSIGDRLEISPTGDGITLDCLILGDGADGVSFKIKDRSVEARRTVESNKMTLSYVGISTAYTVEWAEPVQLVRRYYCTDIGDSLRRCIHDHVSEVIRTKDGIGVYENLLSEPLFLSPGERRTLHFSVSGGERRASVPQPLYTVSANPDGKPYVFSQNMMAANVFLNVVYPIYTRRQFIRHNTPGRNWDSLYSWDSGFIGIGLGAADFDRAYECLYTYLTPVGDKHSPYIFHGSVVPTQIFLYHYLFNRYPKRRGELREIYPMIRQYFDFYANMNERDGQMRSGLTKTWDIFYNSGGWDDYPPQKYLWDTAKSGVAGATVANTTPVITSAVTVLIAKMLRGIASVLGTGDEDYYEAVVKQYSSAIQKHAWNSETGYFSYVVHGEDGYPVGHLKHPDGSDYNMGFDGIYPYVAGITTDGQDTRILDNIQNGLMTPIGVSVVDTRASYFHTDGYWNGSVWMPHQWILWRALFDNGQGELAQKIADTALRLWRDETEDSYCCFEHFMIKSGRGSGFHQFSGLSSPVLSFFESYYTPGRITLGLLGTAVEEKWSDDNTELRFTCNCQGKSPLALIVMKAGYKYRFTVNGRTAKASKQTEGAYLISLEKGSSTVEVKRLDRS